MADTLTIATWNINSVRLRLDQVLRFLSESAPDILCLQETKCPVDAFPRAAFAKAGYAHQVVRGMKGYNGVAILAREPLVEGECLDLCGKPDARHATALVGGGSSAIAIHNYYVPAGGDVADPELNPKFRHKLDVVEEMTRFWERRRGDNARAVLVGDLNIAPLEHDVWSHKQLLDVVSHTPVETAGLLTAMEAGEWTDAMRRLKPEPDKLYSWWSYRSPDWNAADKGRRLDHVWVGRDLAPGLQAMEIRRDTRGWERPSDHVPVIVTLAR